MKFIVLFISIFSLKVIADCGLQGDIDMRLNDCSHLPSPQKNLKVITHVQESNLQYLYNKSLDEIIGPLVSGKCSRPYKRKKRNKIKVCVLKNAHRYYLLGNEIEIMK